MSTTLTGFSCGDDFDAKQGEVGLIEESRTSPETPYPYNTSSGGMDVQPYHDTNAELDMEFWPLQHPLEPADEDRPVKCPIPHSSHLIHDHGRMQDQKRNNESWRKRAELSSTTRTMNKGGNEEEGGVEIVVEPAARAVRKRHHTLTQSTHNVTIFQMLQHYDKFQS